MKPTIQRLSSAFAAGSVSLMLSAVSFSAEVVGEKNPDGSLKKWHRVEVVLDGPQVEESSATFRNYRLELTFTSPGGEVYEVPGFFDADGEFASAASFSQPNKLYWLTSSG